MLHKIGSIFSREKQPEQPLTRFQKSPEMNGIAQAHAKLTAKSAELKILADKNGAQSVEFAMHTIVSNMVLKTDTEIAAFNEKAANLENEDPASIERFRDMHQLAHNLRDFVIVSDTDLDVTNQPITDKPYVRNGLLALTLLALPVIPFIALGATLVAGAACLGGIVMMGPAQKLLINIKAIDMDTETKHLIENYLAVVKATEDNLQKYLASREPQVAPEVVVAGPKV